MPTKPSTVLNKARDEFAPSYVATTINRYQYWAKVVRVVDGDTIDLDVSVGFDISLSKRFRLLGVDTPEVFGVKKNSKEFKKGKVASDFTKSRLPVGKWVETKVYADKHEKYGRYLCEIFVDGKNLNEELIKKGWAANF